MRSIANDKGQVSPRPALRIAENSHKHFSDHRQAALAVLNSESALTWRAGQFLGGLAFSENPPSEKQRAWLAKLLERAGLPPLAEGEANV